jgi:hypothetical protein
MDTTSCPSNISSTIKNISTWNLKTPTDSSDNEGNKPPTRAKFGASSLELQVWSFKSGASSLELRDFDEGNGDLRAGGWRFFESGTKPSKEELYGQITTP